MKNLLLFTALVSFSFASAQITTNAGTFNKPAAGDTAFEMHFMPNLDGAQCSLKLIQGHCMMRSFKSETQSCLECSCYLTVLDAVRDAVHLMS